MKDKCTVVNISSGQVVYSIPELRVRRVFSPREKKNIEVSELEQLSQIPGGMELICNYLRVEDKEVVTHITNMEMPLEYWFTEDKLPQWMNTCGLDEFKDALDFAPAGIKDLIKKLAVSMPLNDYTKREAIKEQLGFDVSKAIENSKDDEPKQETKPLQRRKQVDNTPTVQRRVQPAADASK